MRFTYAISFNPHNSPRGRGRSYSPHFSDEETEAQSNKITCLRVPHQALDRDEMNPGRSLSRALNPGNSLCVKE